MRTFARRFEFGLARQTRIAASGGKVVAVGRDDAIRIFDGRTGASARLRERRVGRVHGVAMSPEGGTAALVVEHQCVHVVDVAKDTDIAQLEGPFRAATFMDEATLWAVVSPDESSCEWQIYDVASCVKIHSLRLDDPVSASAVVVRKHPTFRGMAVSIGGGQDGQMVHFVDESPGGRGASVLFDLQDDLGTPVFHPNGRELLVIVEDGFARYSFPERKLLSHGEWPEDCESRVYYAEYANDELALALADDGRLMLFDLANGEYVDDGQIEGHPARRREEENDADDAVSDLSQLSRLDEALGVSIHYGDRKSTEPERLVFWELGRLGK
jgi:hypothetical protein